jgi:hypothetical protein
MGYAGFDLRFGHPGSICRLAERLSLVGDCDKWRSIWYNTPYLVREGCVMPESPETSTKRWSREEGAEKMAAFEQAYQQTPSQRQLANALEIPRSTLQHWLKRKAAIDADPELVAFFESPVGVAFLHRLVLAAHFVMTLLGPCGIRLVCLFLELSGLDKFVAASYGPQQRVSVAMEEAVVAFDKEERQRLAEGMSPKQIAVCQDETFHPEPCLVAIEPVSNFILLEKYAADRKADTWTSAMAEATAGLAVEIVQSTSDEGRGLLHHVKEDLGIQHSPDVFHVQSELVQGSGGALASQKRRAEQAAAKAAAQVSTYQQEQAAYLNGERDAVCPPELAQQLATVQEQEQAARQALETVTAQHQRVQQAIRGISAAYHPYNLETGAAQSAAEVAAALQQHFAELETVTAEAHLSERCLHKVHKAKRVVVEMVATIAFFFLTVRAKVEALSLAPAVEQAVYANLIPAIYLQLVAAKAPEAEQRRALQHRSEELLAPLLRPDGPLSSLEREELVVIETVARECAQLFQRSSSCVEGRNGQLALRHHSLHRLSNRKLAALTTVHNYFVQRSDSTTAAERFFGAKPRPLFDWVLERVDLPGRPAQPRAQPGPKAYKVPVAA